MENYSGGSLIYASLSMYQLRVYSDQYNEDLTIKLAIYAFIDVVIGREYAHL